jgi:hypothetical protein
MPSSTSSSRLLLRCLCIFAATLAAVVALEALSRSLPMLREHQVLEAVVARPPSADYYQVDETGLLGQHVFFHEMDPVRSPLRSADVLILGNSRSLVAFPDSVVAPFFRERGLSYYQLGFADGRADFALILFEKYDLKPRLAIVNADRFFWPGVSHWSEAAMRDSYFDALKRRYEQSAKFEARRWIHALLPHPIGRDLGGGKPMIYRSVSHGDWLVHWNETRPTAVHWRTPRKGPTRAEIQNAKTFKAELEGRGTALVLTWVPYRIDGRSWVRELADRLEVPVVLPPLPELEMTDGSHLDPPSAQRFSAAFLAELDPLLP